ncbi:MAG: sulfotransferase family 2 domain-containing protein [Saprospiraceae bacterium]|nr:sulfotransferase family 2 domain-containing protein [Saprospiraceae bacterium]
MAIYAVNDIESKFIFIINYKVMYSSLTRILPTYFPSIKFYNKNQVKQFNFSKFTKFSIVRNPYRRTVSTYFDKCQKAPKDSLATENAQLQYCQEQLLKALCTLRKTTYDIVLPAQKYNRKDNPDQRILLDNNLKLLMSVSFKEYVQCLTLLLKNKKVDGHFEMQYKVFDIPRQNPFYNRNKIVNDTLQIKLENIEMEWGNVCDILGKNIELQKINKTDDKRKGFISFYTDETREIVAKCYAKDFEKFNYSRHIHL